MTIALLINLLLVAPAKAVQSASPEAIQAIREQIQKANRLDFDITEAKFNRDLAKKDTPEYVVRDAEYKRQVDRQMAEYTKALHMTIKAYDLPGANAQGTSVVGWTVGRSVDWIPVARAQEDRELENRKGARMRIPQERKPISGRQYADGVSYIDPDTFRNQSVGWLASTILHEYTHFQQITTRGKGDVMSTAAMDKEAYGAEKNHSSIFFDGTDPRHNSEKLDVEEAYLKNEAVVAQEEKDRKGLGGFVRSLLPRPASPNMFDSRVHSPADIEALKRQAGQFSSEAEIVLAKAKTDAERFREDEAERRRAAERERVAAEIHAALARQQREFVERQEMERAFRSALRPSVPAPAVARRPPLGEFEVGSVALIAMKACSVPRQDFSDILANLNWSLFQKAPTLEPYPTRFTGCELRVFQRLATFGASWRSGMSITPGEVLAAASEPVYGSPAPGGGGVVPPSQNHDRVWDRVKPIIR